MPAHGNPVLIDSSYYITLARNQVNPLARLHELRDYFDYDFAICGIIWLEVLRGRSDPHVSRRYHSFFQTLIFLDLSPAAWERVAQLTWELDRKGVVLPATDLTIAACAMEHDVPLLTFDKHFDHIPGLMAVNSLP
jgi:predicted nucleic acid-binding protein